MAVTIAFQSTEERAAAVTETRRALAERAQRSGIDEPVWCSTHPDEAMVFARIEADPEDVTAWFCAECMTPRVAKVTL